MNINHSVPPEKAPVIQAFGSLVPVRLGLGEEVRHRSVAALNRLLAHTIALRDLYKKSHWQTSGSNFYELHLLFDKHHDVLPGDGSALAGVRPENARGRLADAPVCPS